MKKIAIAVLYLVLLLCFLGFTQKTIAQDSTNSAKPANTIREDYFKAEVVEILEEKVSNFSGRDAIVQSLGLTILSGFEKGKDISLIFESFGDGDAKKFEPGARVIVKRVLYRDKSESYQIVDRYRLDGVLSVFIAFLAVVVLMSGKKGVGSILGMGFSLLVLVGIVAPLIVSGYNPLLVSIFGAILIMLVSIYLAHGISKQTTAAVVSTFVSLVLSGVASTLFVFLAGLTGVGSEDSYSLQFALTDIDLKGLLLGGILIGTLGILDDVTTAQSAVVFEIYKTNQALLYRELVKKGLAVGKEHITSLVNTLFLVYAGVSLGLFVIFVLNPLNQPAWVLLNYESLSEEIIRTISGSMILVFAVPISTIIAALTVQKYVKHNHKSRGSKNSRKS